MPGSLRDPVTGETFPLWSRDDWGARPPVERHGLASTREGIFYHHLVTDPTPAPAVLRGAQSWHINGKGWLDIAYSFAVGLAGEHDGHVFVCRGFMVQGGHTENMNSHSHAIVFVGDTDHDAISPKAARAALAIAREIERRHGGNRVRCHGDVASTACPGSQARSWVKAGRPTTPAAPPTPEPEEDDDMSKITFFTNTKDSEWAPRVLGENPEHRQALRGQQHVFSHRDGSEFVRHVSPAGLDQAIRFARMGFANVVFQGGVIGKPGEWPDSMLEELVLLVGSRLDTDR